MVTKEGMAKQGRRREKGERDFAERLQFNVNGKKMQMSFSVCVCVGVGVPT